MSKMTGPLLPLCQADIFSNSFYAPSVHEFLRPFCLPQVNLATPPLVSDIALFSQASPGNKAGFPS